MKTDEILQIEVSQELKCEPSLNSSDVSISAVDGIVTLSGSVPHYADKQIAEGATRRVKGVRAIVEKLEVNLSGVHTRPDGDVAQAVVNSLRWHVFVPSVVQATIEDGWVTLNGSVAWEFQRQSAEESVQFLYGVRGVTNSIELKPTVHASEVKQAIESALTRNAEIDAAHVIVNATGSQVVLGGTVRTWEERRQAATAAWSIPGVTSVKNDLAVTP